MTDRQTNGQTDGYIAISISRVSIAVMTLTRDKNGRNGSQSGQVHYTDAAVPGIKLAAGSLPLSVLSGVDVCSPLCLFAFLLET